MSSQIVLDLPSSDFQSASVLAAIETLAGVGDAASRGAVFTRPEVVDFILDLAGYTLDQPLYQQCLLEPSFGGGDFLLPITTRLVNSLRKSGTSDRQLSGLQQAITAVELHRETFEVTRAVLLNRLRELDVPAQVAIKLTDHWLKQGDFLLQPLPEKFDYVVGNPPYVRQELIPEPLLAEYRGRFRTMYDRADLYVPFIERSLLSLKPGGQLAFICSDRWMKNRYGGPLRQLVAEQFHLQAYVDMVDTPAFQSDVIAYPAIVLIKRGPAGSTRLAQRPVVDPSQFATLARALRGESVAIEDSLVREATAVVSRTEPWLLERPDQMSLLRRLEERFPLLEETGCKVGIGVATGADSAFIGPMNELDVEDDRKLPLVMTRDIDSGEVRWRGLGVINPFVDEGGLVNLESYPRLARYLEARREKIAGRHCAQKSPAGWFRTIDRINPKLAACPKLLIPDIKGEAHIVFEPGKLYPHHNLYYVTSEQWDLRALQAVLLSKVSRLFIATYSTKMRGGYLRFQAQYLRRIRLPHWREVPEDLRKALADAAISRNQEACDRATFALYGLLPHEQQLLMGAINHGA